MNISKAKQEIKDTIEAYLQKDEFGAYEIPPIRQRPVLLIGPPGVGKTQIMEQISQECRIGLVSYTITHHTRQSAVGLPFIEHKKYGGKDYAVTEYTMSEIVASIYDKIEVSGLPEGILFIDEINCVSETLAPTMLQFLQCKSFGAHKIPEGWIIVAAGNPPEFNKSVRDFDIVTLDRLRMIQVEPDYEVWRDYAVKANVHPAILSYLGIKKQNLCQIETTVDGKFFATPRGWEDMSELLRIYEKMNRRPDRDVVMEYIQYPAIAKDFANYLELYYKYREDYRIDELLDGRLPDGVFDKMARAPFDEKISIVGLLLAGLNGQFRKAGEQAALLEKLQQELKECKSKFDQLADSNADVDARSGSYVETMQDQAYLYETKMKHEKTAGLLARRTEREHLMVLHKLEAYTNTLRDCHAENSEAAWQCIRAQFLADSDVYEQLMEQGGAMLEHAFDFMEGAFGTGQEMVMFVTELNSGYYSVNFLQEYSCERYFQYNQALLFDEKEDRIRRQIEELG